MATFLRGSAFTAIAILLCGLATAGGDAVTSTPPARVALNGIMFEPAEDSYDRFSGHEFIKIGSFGYEGADSDVDGVSDIEDICPDTPAGTEVDFCGCPVNLCAIDSDSDGVPDCRDKCKRTLKGLKVDANGCPLPITATARITLDVKYEFAKANIQGRYVPDLERLKDLLIRFPNLSVVLEGHTDARGSHTYNDALSLSRARMCRRYLTQDARIDASRITTRGFGKRIPIASNLTEEGRQLNRRTIAEISVPYAMPIGEDGASPPLPTDSVPLGALTLDSMPVEHVAETLHAGPSITTSADDKAKAGTPQAITREEKIQLYKRRNQAILDSIAERRRKRLAELTPEQRAKVLQFENTTREHRTGINPPSATLPRSQSTPTQQANAPAALDPAPPTSVFVTTPDQQPLIPGSAKDAVQGMQQDQMLNNAPPGFETFDNQNYSPMAPPAPPAPSNDDR